jgi:hypothetical protein
MDAVNAALYALLNPLAAGGAWNLAADDGTPLPLIKFQLVIPDYDYSFGGLSTIRLPYRVTAHAEDTPAAAGAVTAALLAESVRAALTDPALSVPGYDVELCRPYSGLPAEIVRRESRRDEYTAGVLVEILLTPS